MTRKQGWLLGITLGLLSCGLLSGGFVYLLFFVTRGPVEAADKFLALLGEGKVKEAYASTAEGFRNSTPEERFDAAVRRWKLTDYRSASWHSREVMNNTGTVEGTVTTRDGKVIPLKISFLHEDGAWKVVRLEPLQGIGLPAQALLKVPGDEEVRALERQTLLDFNRAVQTKEFKNCHDGVPL